MLIDVSFVVFKETGPGSTAVRPDADPLAHSPTLLRAHQDMTSFALTYLHPAQMPRQLCPFVFWCGAPAPLVCGLPHYSEPINPTLGDYQVLSDGHRPIRLGQTFGILRDCQTRERKYHTAVRA